MAGIGFRIQKLLTKDSYLENLTGFTLGAFVAVGPVLAMMGTVLAFSLIGPVHNADAAAFRVLLVHCQLTATIVTAPLVLPLTRHLADCLYSGQHERILPAFCTACAAAATASAAAALLYLHGVGGLAWTDAATMAPLAAAAALVWIAAVFVSTAREYLAIALAFVAGAALAVSLGLLCGRRGTEGFIFAFIAGNLLTFVLLSVLLLREFPLKSLWEPAALGSILRHPLLALGSLALTLGLWADKIVAWVVMPSAPIMGRLPMCSDYDTASFYAYLSTIPAMTWFILQFETAFYLRYRLLFDSVLRQAPLEALLQAQSDLRRQLGRDAAKAIVIQLTITAILLYLINPLMRSLDMNAAQWSILRFCLLGCFCLCLMQITITIMLYFEFQGSVLLVSTLFLVLNSLGSWLLLRDNPQLAGAGFYAAAALSLIVGAALVCHHSRDLLFFTFSRQRILPPKE